MGRKICVIFAMLLFLFASGMVLAEEAKDLGKAVKIERVRWSGLGLFGLKIFGSWATVPEGQVKLFGGNSPYFRLNGDDETIFRGLGRENRLAQRIFPTLRSQRRLQEIVSGNDMARQSLMKYDTQVAAGEKINMISGSLSFGGKVGMATGFVMMFIGLSDTEAVEAGETPIMTKTGYAVGVAGLGMWVIGQLGEIAGELVTKQAFSHLYDSMEYYNSAQARVPAQSQIMLGVGF